MASLGLMMMRFTPRFSAKTMALPVSPLRLIAFSAVSRSLKMAVRTSSPARTLKVDSLNRLPGSLAQAVKASLTSSATFISRSPSFLVPSTS